MLSSSSTQQAEISIFFLPHALKNVTEILLSQASWIRTLPALTQGLFAKLCCSVIWVTIQHPAFPSGIHCFSPLLKSRGVAVPWPWLGDKWVLAWLPGISVWPGLTQTLPCWPSPQGLTRCSLLLRATSGAAAGVPKPCEQSLWFLLSNPSCFKLPQSFAKHKDQMKIICLGLAWVFCYFLVLIFLLWANVLLSLSIQWQWRRQVLIRT